MNKLLVFRIVTEQQTWSVGLTFLSNRYILCDNLLRWSVTPQIINWPIRLSSQYQYYGINYLASLFHRHSPALPQLNWVRGLNKTISLEFETTAPWFKVTATKSVHYFCEHKHILMLINHLLWKAVSTMASHLKTQLCSHQDARKKIEQTTVLIAG